MSLSPACGLVMLALVAGAPPKSRPGAAKASAGKTAPPAGESQPAAAPETSSRTIDAAALRGDSRALLAEARKRFDALEYDRAAQLTRVITERGDLPLAELVSAFLILGSSLSVIADPTDAESPFRALLRLDPSFDLAADTAPKILNVFRKVQFEEQRVAAQTRALIRQKIAEGIQVTGELPKSGRGGDPVQFSLELRDPTGAVAALRIGYRRGTDQLFSSLALVRDGVGIWRGAIPGETTASPTGFNLEYYVEVSDSLGPLRTMGSTTAPLLVAISPGRFERASPPPLPPWVFWTSTVVAGAGAVIGGVLWGLTVSSQAEYDRLAQAGRMEPGIDGPELKALEARGQNLATATRASFISAGAMLLGAGLVAIFTDWDGRPAS